MAAKVCPAWYCSPVCGAAPEGAPYLLGEQDGGEWRIPAREPFPDAEDVRPHAGLLGREPGAEPSEPGHDLVEDQEHARLVAERAQPTEVVVGERVHAGRQHHRLDDDRGDGAGTLVLDHVPHLRQAAEGARARAGPARARDRSMSMDPAGEERFVRRPELRPTRRGESSHGGPVVGAIERDRLVTLGTAALAVVLPRHLERRFRRLRSAGELLDDVVPPARNPDQRRGQLECAVRRRHDRRREGETPVLGSNRVDDLVVAVTETDCEHAREAVDIASPLVIRERDAVTLDHDQRIRREGLHLIEIDHDVAGCRAQVDGLDVGSGGLRHGRQSGFVRPVSQVALEVAIGRSEVQERRLDLSDQGAVRSAAMPAGDLSRTRGPGVASR